MRIRIQRPSPERMDTIIAWVSAIILVVLIASDLVDRATAAVLS